MVRAPKRPATYADLCALPEHQVGEIVDGELVASPRPAPRHSRVESRLTADLDGPFDKGRGGPGGWVILAEPELHLGADVLVPDLAGWRRHRLSDFPAEPYFTLPPDWACEVLSPSTARLDRVQKVPIYAREKVAHVWLVDPQAQTLEVLALDGPTYRLIGSHAGDEKVRAPPFDAIELELAPLWRL
jgi:Uma2 family endonuclease